MLDRTWILDKITRHHENICFIDDKENWTYMQLASHVVEWQRHLKEQSIVEGSPFVLVGDYSIDAIACLLASIIGGCIVAPLISSSLDSSENVATLIGARKIIVINQLNWESRDVLEQKTPPLICAMRERGESGLVLLSSGSTGSPKAMVLSIDKLISKYRDREQKRACVLLFLLFDHIGGVNTLLHTLLNGGTLVPAYARTPRNVLALVEKYKIEVLPTTPTFINILLISGLLRDYELSSIKMVTYGTEAMPEKTLVALHHALPGVILKQTYGLSEIGIFPTKSESNTSLWMKIGDEKTRVKVVDGVLWVKCDTAMLGYLNADSPFDDDGWLCTDDMVETRDDYFRILGRRKSFINVGGEKVHPIEIENCILSIPGVLDVIAWPKRNPVTGHIVAATIKIAKETDVDALQKRIRTYCHTHLPLYKIPRHLRFTTEDLHSDRFKKIGSICK